MTTVKTQERVETLHRDRDVHCTAVQLDPIRGKCCCRSKGKVTSAPPLAKTSDTKDILLVNFVLEQCRTSSSNATAHGHSVMSPDDLLGLTADVLL